MGLLRAGSIAGRNDLREIADRVLLSHASRLERSAEALPSLARAALTAERGISVAIIVGDPQDEATRALATRARAALRPEDAAIVARPDTSPVGVDPAWFAGRNSVGGRPTAYVCHGTECSLPVFSPDELAILC
jgi:uncharacterized protein YyaL (SSP411 family)